MHLQRYICFKEKAALSNTFDSKEMLHLKKKFEKYKLKVSLEAETSKPKMGGQMRLRMLSGTMETRIYKVSLKKNIGACSICSSCHLSDSA